MKKIYKKIIQSIVICCVTIMERVGMILSNVENNIFKSDPNITDEKNKKNIRKRHSSDVLEKFYQGQRDEKYVQQYYEILKKSDQFIENSTAERIAQVSDRYRMSYGIADRQGEIHEHFGFFDKKHKYAGKTIKEVKELEMQKRKFGNDKLDVLYMISNKPYELGLKNAIDTVSNLRYENVDEFSTGETIINKSLKRPLRIVSNCQNRINKIELLADYMHVKKLGDLEEKYRMFEFFIPRKYKLYEHDENSSIFNEVINFYQVYVTDKYGDLLGFTIEKYVGRDCYCDDPNNPLSGYEILKFIGIEIKMY